MNTFLEYSFVIHQHVQKNSLTFCFTISALIEPYTSSFSVPIIIQMQFALNESLNKLKSEINMSDGVC